MPSKRFQRTKEDFICGHCGTQVEGNGYTNHCPECLYSQHVDVNPGDREATCGGLMKPVAIETKRGDQYILHRCAVCGFERNNKAQPNDSFETILNISADRPL